MRFFSPFSVPRRVLPLVLALLTSVIPSARAQVDVTWTGLGADSDWSTAGNWTTGTVPNANDARATFNAASGAASVGISAVTYLDRLTFAADALANSVTLSNSLTFYGAGILNQSAFAPTLELGSTYLTFNNSSTAGNATINNGGVVTFNNSSTAGTAAIVGLAGSGLSFFSSSSADHATITLLSGSNRVLFSGSSSAGHAVMSTVAGGGYFFFGANTTAANASITISNNQLYFSDNASAGSSSITLNQGGSLIIYGSATAGAASITVNSGGVVRFEDTSTGGTASFTLNAGGSIDASRFSGTLELASVAGAGGLNLGSSALTVGGSNLSTTISGVIADGGNYGGTGAALIKAGTGTLTLSGANTYTGTTTITGGSLLLDHSSALAGSTLAYNSGDAGTLSFGTLTAATFGGLSGDKNLALTNTTPAAVALTVGGNNASTTYSGILSGTGSALTKTGTDTLTLSGANTYNGGTTVSAGTLAMANVSALGSGAASVASGATLDSSTYGFDLTRISGAGTLTGSGTYAYNSAASASLATILGGAANLSKAGAGTLTLSGANTYTGTSSITGGTLGLGAADALAGSTLGYNSADSGTLSFGTLTAATFGGLSGDKNLALTNTTPAAVALSVGGNNGSTTFSGILSGTDSALTKTGTGTLTLSGANTYTGGTTISAGTLAMGSASALGTGAVSVASGATLDSSTYGFDLTRISGAGTLTGTGTYAYNSASSASLATILGGTGATLTKSGAGTLTLSGANTFTGGTTISNGTVQFSALNNFGTGNITLDGGILQWATGTTTDVSARLTAITANAGTFDTNGNNVTFATALVNTGGFRKNGAGTLTLSGANSTTALSLVNLGTLALDGATSSLTAPGNYIGSYTAASLSLTGGATLTATTNGILVQQLGATPITIDGIGSTLTTIGYDHFYGALNITAGGRLVSSDFASFGTGGNNTALPINVTGTGSLLDVATQLSLSLTSPGVLTIGSGGTVRVGGELRLDSGVRASTLNLNTEGTLEVGGTDGIKQSFGSNLNFSGGTLKIIGTALTSSVPATLSGTTTIDTNGLGATLSGELGASGGLTKTGAGALTLSGVNTYAGATAVNAGSLLVTGSLANTAVSVASGATLGGGGTFAGLTTLASGGILAPGTSPGTITFNAGLTLAGGSILNFELGTASDLIVVGGGLLSGPSSGTVTLNFSDSGGFGAGTYTLINYATATGTSNFSVGSFSLGSTVSGYNYVLGLSGNTLQLTASAIPEPSTYAAIFGAAALGFAMWRRRKSAGMAGTERA